MRSVPYRQTPLYNARDARENYTPQVLGALREEEWEDPGESPLLITYYTNSLQVDITEEREGDDEEGDWEDYE